MQKVMWNYWIELVFSYFIYCIMRKKGTYHWFNGVSIRSNKNTNRTFHFSLIVENRLLGFMSHYFWNKFNWLMWMNKMPQREFRKNYAKKRENYGNLLSQSFSYRLNRNKWWEYRHYLKGKFLVFNFTSNFSKEIKWFSCTFNCSGLLSNTLG